MAQSPRCPACNSPLDLSSNACQICLRPVSRQEIVRALQAGRRHDQKIRRGIYVLAALFVFAAAFAALPGFRGPVLKIAGPGIYVARAAGHRVSAYVKKNWPDTAPDDDHPVTPQSSFNAASNAETGSSTPQPQTPAPQSSAAPAPTAAPAPVVPVEEHAKIVLAPTWKISGLVYFLRDAKPAASVELSFSSTEDGAVRRARADRAGRYVIALPALSSATGQGYRISIASSGRKLAYLEEASLPYRERTQAQREDAIEEARQSPVLHAPLSPEAAETAQDFAILP